MARDIALRLNINGTDRAIRSINDLEQGIEELNQQLKNVDIGSEEFQRLSAELRNADSQLKTLETTFEGLEPQQQVESFVLLGEGIAGAFAAATAAIQLFGGESEDIEEAQLAITQAITIALGARAIAEGALQLRIVASTIAQKAYNLSVRAGNVLTQRFFALIAANPIGALLTAIGAVTAALLIFNNRTEDAVDVTEQLNDANDEAIKSSRARISDLRALQNVINDTTASETQRAEALRELQEVLPEIEGLTLDNKDALELLNAAIENNIELTLLQAQVEATRELLIEKNKELIDLRNESLTEEFTTIGLILRATGERIGLLSVEEIALEGLNRRKERQVELEQDINEITTQYERLLRELLERQGQQNQNLEEEEDRKKELERIQERRNKQLEKEIELIRGLGVALSIDYGTSNIQEQLDNILSTIRELQFFEDLSFDDLVESLTIAPVLESLENQAFKSFLEISAQLTDALVDPTKSFEELFEVVNNLRVEANRLVESDIIDRAQRTQLESLFVAFDNYFELLNRVPVEASDAFANLNNVLIENVNRFGELPETLDEVTKAQQEAIEAYSNLDLEEFDGLSQEQIQKLAETFVESFSQITESAALSDIELIDSLANINETIRQIFASFEPSSANAAFRQLILENTDLLARQYDVQLDLTRRFFGERQRLAENELTIQQALAEANINLEDFTREEQLAIIEAFYERQRQLREQNEIDTKSSFEFTVEGIRDTLNEFTIVAQAAVDVFRISAENQLLALEAAEEQTLANIVGTTEEAEAKRLQVQQEFAEKRRQVEKESRIASLELARIQALANIAEAITKAFTDGPVIGQVLAGVVAALGAIQVGFISEQIGQVRNLALGGLIQGSSHEMGGVDIGNGLFAEGGEAMINRDSTTRYRGLLSSINKVGGGNAIADTNVATERLSQAIAKTKDEPIRAYVLEQDITNKQSVNKRLKDLSKI